MTADPDLVDDDRFERVAAVDDLDDSGRVVVAVDGTEVAVFRRGDDYYAYRNRCPPEGGPACSGPMKGRIVLDADGRWGYDDDESVVCCAWHGWEFDVETGEHLSNPAYRLRAYDVAVDDGNVYVRT